MRRPFAASVVVAVAFAAAVAVFADYTPLQPASGGSTAQPPPVKATKLCRNCGVVKQVDEVAVRGESRRYDIVVRTEDGLVRIVSTETRPRWRVGDRVRVANGKIAPI
jgi:hypothetical protein